MTGRQTPGGRPEATPGPRAPAAEAAWAILESVPLEILANVSRPEGTSLDELRRQMRRATSTALLRRLERLQRVELVERYVVGTGGAPPTWRSTRKGDELVRCLEDLKRTPSR